MNRLCLVIFCLFSVKLVSPTIYAKVQKKHKDNTTVIVNIGESENKLTSIRLGPSNAEEREWASILKPGFIKLKANTILNIYIGMEFDLKEQKAQFEESSETTEYIVYYGFSWEGYNFKEDSFELPGFSRNKLTFYVYFLDPKLTLSGWAGLAISPILVLEEGKMALDIELACGAFDETSKKVQPKGEVFIKMPYLDFDRPMLKFSGEFDFNRSRKAVPLENSIDDIVKTTFVDSSDIQVMKVKFFDINIQISKVGFANMIFPLSATQPNLEISMKGTNTLIVKGKTNRII